MNQIGEHLRSNVVGYVAVFLALCGGAYAAGLEKGSVGSKQIKNGEVKEADLADKAVSGKKIVDGDVKGSHLADMAVSGKKIVDGAITSPKLIDGAVSSPKLGNGAVTPSKLGTLPTAGLFGATYNETGGNFCAGANSSFPNNTLSSVEFTAEQFDTAGLASPLGTDCYSGINALPPGTYVVTASVTWAQNATGVRAISILVGGGGSPGVSQVQAVSGGETRQSVSAIVRDPGSVTLRAFQNSGAPLALFGGNFAVAWVGP